MIDTTLIPLVRHVMSPDPLTVQVGAPAMHAASLLASRDVSGLPVVDAAGALVGVISQADILHARSTPAVWRRWPRLKAWHLMSSPAHTVTTSTPLTLAAAVMDRHGVRRLVVLADDGSSTPVGVLSATDLVDVLGSGCRLPWALPAATPVRGES